MLFKSKRDWLDKSHVIKELLRCPSNIKNVVDTMVSREDPVLFRDEINRRFLDFATNKKIGRPKLRPDGWEDHIVIYKKIADMYFKFGSISKNSTRKENIAFLARNRMENMILGAANKDIEEKETDNSDVEQHIELPLVSIMVPVNCDTNIDFDDQLSISSAPKRAIDELLSQDNGDVHDNEDDNAGEYDSDDEEELY